MKTMIFALIPVLIAIFFYLYKFLKRICETFGINTNNKWARVVIIVTTVFFTVMCINIASVGALIVLHIVMIALLVQFVNFIVKKIAGKIYIEGFLPWKKIYGSGVIPVFLTAVILILGYLNLHNVVETNYTIYTHKNIRSEGYRIVLIADVHFGVSLNYDELLEKCHEISKKNADVVILCGDVVDNSTSAEELKLVFAALGTIKSEYGIFYVHGNHDRPMSVIESKYTEDDLIDAIEANGIRILQDDTVQVTDDLVLIGRDDKSIERTGKSRLSIDELVSSVDQEDFILTLDHQPNQYAENGRVGTDLLLSGHTHGGQLFPINLLMKIIKFNDAVYGHYKIDEDTQAIVTSGFAGWSYPVKTAAPSEYVIIDILNH